MCRNETRICKGGQIRRRIIVGYGVKFAETPLRGSDLEGMDFDLEGFAM